MLFISFSYLKCSKKLSTKNPVPRKAIFQKWNWNNNSPQQTTTEFAADRPLKEIPKEVPQAEKEVIPDCANP